MVNATIKKFGHPASLVRQFDHWSVLVRPAQVTLGSLVIAARSDATAYSALPDEAFAEQGEVVRAVERALAAFCAYEKINYLMLMMVDPHVHFHVIPRYSGERQWKGLALADAGWPGPPSLGSATALDERQITLMRAEIERLM